MKTFCFALALLASPAAAFDVDKCVAEGGDGEQCVMLGAKMLAATFGPISPQMCAAYDDADMRLNCFDDFMRTDENPYYSLRDQFDWHAETVAD